MSESIAFGQSVDLPVRAGDSLKIGYLGGSYSAVATAGLSGLPSALATNATTSQTLGPWARNIVVRLSTSAGGRVEYAVGNPPVFAPTGNSFVRTSDGVPVELKGLGANAEYLAAGSNPTAPASLAASGSYSTSLTEGTRYESAAPTVTGGVPPYAFGSAGGRLPFGMRINPETGVMFGVPSVQGGYPSTKVRASDQLGSFIDMTVGTITVGSPSGATVPAAPTAPTATAGDGAVSLAFTAPSNGGSAILEYGALLSNGNANTGTPSASPVSVVTPNGVAVTGQISARNAIGWGPYSPASNSVTPAAAAVSGLQFSRRQGAPSSPLSNSTNATQFNAASTINNQLGVPMTNIRLGWINAINHAVNGSMIPAPRMTAFEVGVSPPGTTSGTRTLITFGGQTRITAEPGAEIISDPIAVNLNAGTSMRVMVFAEYETAPGRLPSSNINANDNTNELNEGATSGLVSKAAGTAMPASRIQSKVILCPAFAIGEPVGTPTTLQRIGFYGDSITSGADDSTTGSVVGMAQRGCHAANVPWVAASTEGYSYGVMPAGSDARRFTLFPFRGCSHVISFLGVNDIRNRVLLPSEIYARMVEIKGTLDAWGVKLIVSTIWPNTNAGNTGEVMAGDWDRLNALNTLIRDNNGVGYGFFELNALVRDSVNPNLWATPSAPDGTHPGTTHHTTVANAITAFIPTLT